jgi:hypothetical protein
MKTNPNPDPSNLVLGKFSKAAVIAQKVGMTCTKTIFRWAQAGHITPHRINQRVVLFDEAEVARFIANSSVRPEFRAQ